MRRTHAVRWIALSAVAVVVPGMSMAAPAAAAESVHIEAATSFSDPVSLFTSDLDGCDWGTVENGRFAAPPSRGLGTFSGAKVFTCLVGDMADVEHAVGVGGFTLHLTAHFPVGPGSIGRWSVVDSWGSVDGMRANGSLVGEGNDEGINDIYDGTIRAGG